MVYGAERMIVSSISDLYFIASGLYALSVLTDVLVKTGLFLLPFIMATFNALKEGRFEARETLLQLEWQIYLMLAVLVLAFAPMRPFELDNVYTYARQCEVSEQGNVDFGLVDDDLPVSDITVLLSGKELKMPFLVEFAFKLGTAISFETVGHLPCSMNLQGIANGLLDSRIKDQRLLVETKEFIKQCYRPALNLVSRNNDTNVSWIHDPDTLSQPWPGHADFMNSAYYGNVGRGFYSRSLIPSFQAAKTNKSVAKWYESWQAEKDGIIECDGTCLHELGGFPSCQEWWQGIGSGYSGWTSSSSDKGLRKRLLDNIPEDLKGRTLVLLLAFESSQSKTWYEDKLIEKSLFNSFSVNRIENAEVRDYGLQGEGVGGTLGTWFNRMTGTLGNIASALPDYAGASLTQLAAPIIKGGVILVLVTAFPLVMVVSKFDIKLATAMTFLLGSVMLWPFFWELTILLQKSYIETVATESGVAVVDLITQPNVMLLSNRITDALFIGFPVFITSILSYAGIGVGNTLSSMSGSMGSGTASAGQKGVKIAGNAAKKAASKGMAK